MKYVITGGAGNISRPLAENLLAAGQDVVVIARDPKHLEELENKGAKSAVGSIDDQDFLVQAFAGADAVYIMFPPQFAAMDIAVYREQSARYAEAIRANNVKYIVMLSSIGAHMPEGCGPVSGLHLAEEELKKLSGVNILFLRPGYFYVNFYGSMPVIKHMNVLGGNGGDANKKIIMSHPKDIAHAAAEELIKLEFTGHKVRYLASDERTNGEIAKVLGTAIGKPELPWVEFTDEQAQGGMLQAGLPETMVSKYVEMGGAMRSGKMWEDFDQHRPEEFGQTKLEDFAKEFAVAYK
jgi:uncharacterized protein YbjT (DUF2867 family)